MQFRDQMPHCIDGTALAILGPEIAKESMVCGGHCFVTTGSVEMIHLISLFIMLRFCAVRCMSSVCLIS